MGRVGPQRHGGEYNDCADYSTCLVTQSVWSKVCLKFKHVGNIEISALS